MYERPSLHHPVPPGTSTKATPRSLPYAAASAGARVLLASLFIAACARIAVPLPWTPVPMTMQPFGVLLVALLLGPAAGAATATAYLLEGLAGLPVFVPGFGGLLPLGASTGYLLSYPLAAGVTGLLFGQGQQRSFLRALLAGAAGSVLILCCGAAWLCLVIHGSAATSFRLGVLPFVAGDSLKVVLAALLATVWLRTRSFHRVERGSAAVERSSVS